MSKNPVFKVFKASIKIMKKTSRATNQQLITKITQ